MMPRKKKVESNQTVHSQMTITRKTNDEQFKRQVNGFLCFLSMRETELMCMQMKEIERTRERNEQGVVYEIWRQWQTLIRYRFCHDNDFEQNAVTNNLAQNGRGHVEIIIDAKCEMNRILVLSFECCAVISRWRHWCSPSLVASVFCFLFSYHRHTGFVCVCVWLCWCAESMLQCFIMSHFPLCRGNFMNYERFKQQKCANAVNQKLYAK